MLEFTQWGSIQCSPQRSKKCQGFRELIRKTTTWFNHTCSCTSPWSQNLQIDPDPDRGWATSGLLNSASFLKRRCWTELCELCSRSRWACLFRALGARSSDSSVREDMDLIPTGNNSFCVFLNQCSLVCHSPLQWPRLRSLVQSPGVFPQRRQHLWHFLSRSLCALSLLVRACTVTPFNSKEINCLLFSFCGWASPHTCADILFIFLSYSKKQN